MILLEDGATYVTRSGKHVTVTYSNDSLFPYIGNNDTTYTQEGRRSLDKDAESDKDIVAKFTTTTVVTSLYPNDNFFPKEGIEYDLVGGGTVVLTKRIDTVGNLINYPFIGSNGVTYSVNGKQFHQRPEIIHQDIIPVEHTSLGTARVLG